MPVAIKAEALATSVLRYATLGRRREILVSMFD
jgi:hypothetical protein